MDLAWVSVKDIAKATEFFTQTLGLQKLSGDEQYKWVELGGSDGGVRLGVGECTTKDDSTSLVQAGQNAVVTMTVNDLDAARKHLTEKGVNFVGEIIEVPGHVKMIFFKDIDGNIFQLVQMLG